MRPLISSRRASVPVSAPTSAHHSSGRHCGAPLQPVAWCPWLQGLPQTGAAAPLTVLHPCARMPPLQALRSMSTSSACGAGRTTCSGATPQTVRTSPVRPALPWGSWPHERPALARAPCRRLPPSPTLTHRLPPAAAMPQSARSAAPSAARSSPCRRRRSAARPCCGCSCCAAWAARSASPCWLSASRVRAHPPSCPGRAACVRGHRAAQVPTLSP